MHGHHVHDGAARRVAATLLAAAAAASGCVLCDQQRRAAAGPQLVAAGPRAPLAAFSAPQYGQRVVNATVFSVGTLRNASACAQACLDYDPSCIAFTWLPDPQAGGGGSSCVGSGWGPRFATGVAPPGAAYYSRVRHGNTSSVRPAVVYALTVPVAGVELHSGPLADAFAANVRYLIQVPADDMLHWFRRRAGQSNPPGGNWGWDNSGVDAPEGLRGSVAGAFLMGAGGIARWQPNAAGGALRQRVAEVVAGIRACREPDGYIMAFPRNESGYHENPDYVTAWLTHGLLEAAVAGEAEALALLRGHFDWFNSAKGLPLFLPPALPAGTGPFFDSNGHSVRKSAQFEHGHEIYLIYQGIIHNSRLALSPNKDSVAVKVGQQQDVDTVALRYEEEWWLRQLAARNLSAIWLRSKYPHNYEITAIEAYMDMYELTGDPKYLAAVDGFWEMFRKYWLHIGGTVAIKEWKLYPPGSYFLDTWGNTAHLNGNCTIDPASLPDPLCPLPLPPPGDGRDPEADVPCKGGCTHSTGETCGQVFWIKLAQRLHRLRPMNESYVAEIERVLYNGVISQIPPVDGRGVNRVDPAAGRGGNWSRTAGTVVGIRQFAVLHLSIELPQVLHRQKMKLSNISTCCEGQATRMLGSLPEYIVSYDVAGRALHLNLFADATASLAPLGLGEAAVLRVRTAWPYSSNVSVTLALPAADAGRLTLMLRIPAWVAAPSVSVSLAPAGGGRARSVGTGAPGSYLKLDRSDWVGGDTLSFSLPMRLKAHRYTGLTVIPGHERYAVEFGPILLCVVGGAWNRSIDSMLVRGVQAPAAAPERWLIPTGRPSEIRFRVVGNPGLAFVPYFLVQEEVFEVYPAFEPV